jgi:hypothetical protein
MILFVVTRRSADFRLLRECGRWRRFVFPLVAYGGGRAANCVASLWMVLWADDAGQYFRRIYLVFLHDVFVTFLRKQQDI